MAAVGGISASAVSMSGPGATTGPGDRPEAEALQNQVAVPNEAIQQAGVTPARRELAGIRVTSALSASDIPTPALVAYQRAETVIRSAAKNCSLDWALLAAIGRVESDHGRYGGSQLTDQGLDEPAIIGPRLDGHGKLARVADTDAGRLDRDMKFDRAVGPMQFLPSTWSEVGVDADGDNRRDPQDIDDAALGAAVYLCSGNAHLATDEGRRTAIYRYNHSRAYVELVLKIREAYLEYGEYDSGTPIVTGPIDTTPVTSSTAIRTMQTGQTDAHGRRYAPAARQVRLQVAVLEAAGAGKDGHGQGPDLDVTFPSQGSENGGGPDVGLPGSSPSANVSPTRPTSSGSTSIGTSPSPSPTRSTSTTSTTGTTTSPSATDGTSDATTSPSPTESTTQETTSTEVSLDAAADLEPAWKACVTGHGIDTATIDGSEASVLSSCIADSLGVTTDNPDLVAFIQAKIADPTYLEN